jgi:hypothetical protein
MVSRRPLVIEDGLVSELSQGDLVQTGGSSTELVAGSGLVGGGSVGPNIRLDFAVAPNPSGVIYVGDTIGNDGVASVNATIALASGNKADTESFTALSSGNAALSTAVGALASGNAALDLVPTNGGPTAVLTASSVIQAGNPVGVDDAGKASVITTVTDVNSRSFGSAVVFEPAESTFIHSTYDSTNNKVVIAYADGGNGSYGTAVVGTVSGTSTSFGTPVVFESANSPNIDITYDSTNERVVIAYSDYGNSGYGTAIVGTVSGTSTSFGTAVVFESANTPEQMSVIFDSTNNKVVIAYKDGGNSNYGTSIVGTVSGTSISFGTAVVFESALIKAISSVYDSTNERVVIAYSDRGNSDYGNAIVGTVSGTSISFGTAVVFESASTNYTSVTYDPSNTRVVISYSDIGNSSYGTAIVGTVSGTSISFGTAVVFNNAETTDKSSSYDSTNNQVVTVYRDDGNSNQGTVIVGTVSGTSISFGPEVVFNTASTFTPSALYDPTNNKLVISYQDVGNSYYGTSIVGSPGSSTFPTISSYNNFIGISQSTVASGSPCLVNLPGALYTDPTAGLTTGEFYYADPTTSGVTTTSTKPAVWDGQVPWNYIGRAVTSSGLMLLKSI